MNIKYVFDEERPGLSSGGLLMSLARVHRHCQLRCSVSDANSAYCKGGCGETSIGSIRVPLMIIYGISMYAVSEFRYWYYAIFV